jgi:hypothetical protein
MSPDEILEETRQLIKAGIFDENTLQGLKSEIEIQIIETTETNYPDLEHYENAITNALAYLVLVMVKQDVLSGYYRRFPNYGALVSEYAHELWDSPVIIGNTPESVDANRVVKKVFELLRQEPDVWNLIQEYSGG